MVLKYWLSGWYASPTSFLSCSAFAAADPVVPMPWPIGSKIVEMLSVQLCERWPKLVDPERRRRVLAGQDEQQRAARPDAEEEPR